MIEINEWEKAERIIDEISVSEWKCGALSFNDYHFLMNLIDKGKKQCPQVPALFKPQEGVGFAIEEGWGLA